MRPSNAHLATAAAAGLLYLWWRRRRRPTCVVDGCDVYVVDAKDADDVIDRLDGDVLGVDVEWPSATKPRCAVLQIASKNACVVIRVGSATCLPPRTTLRLKRSICVGVGIREDCQLILRDVGCACGRQVDLRTLANQRDAGLASFAAEFAPSASLPHKKNEIACGGATGRPNSRYRRSSTPPATPSHLIKWRSASAGASAPLGEWLRAAPAAARHQRSRGRNPHQQHKTTRAPSTSKRAAAATRPGTRNTRKATTTTISRSCRKVGGFSGWWRRARRTGTATAGWGRGMTKGASSSTTTPEIDYDPEIVDDGCGNVQHYAVLRRGPRPASFFDCGNTQHLTRFYVVPYRTASGAASPRPSSSTRRTMWWRSVCDAGTSSSRPIVRGAARSRRRSGRRRRQQ